MHKKAAFTMVELIFVIVILGILAAVAVPRLNASREDAKLTKLVSDVVTIMRDARSYYAAKGVMYKMRSFSEAEVPNAKNECEKIAKDVPLLLASWDGATCTWRHRTYSAESIEHITNVQLIHVSDKQSVLRTGDARCIDFFAGSLRNGDAKPGDENYFSVATEFRPDADASGGDEALCKRLLAHPAVKQALTNEKGDTLGVRGFDPSDANHTSANCPKEGDWCLMEFNLAGSGVNFD